MRFVLRSSRSRSGSASRSEPPPRNVILYNVYCIAIRIEVQVGRAVNVRGVSSFRSSRQPHAPASRGCEGLPRCHRNNPRCTARPFRCSTSIPFIALRCCITLHGNCIPPLFHRTVLRGRDRAAALSPRARARRRLRLAAAPRSCPSLPRCPAGGYSFCDTHGLRPGRARSLQHCAPRRPAGGHAFDGRCRRGIARL